MNGNEFAYPQKDRWAYLWLVIGTLVSILWRMPLAWWLAPIFLLRFSRSQNGLTTPNRRVRPKRQLGLVKLFLAESTASRT